MEVKRERYVLLLKKSIFEKMRDPAVDNLVI